MATFIGLVGCSDNGGDNGHPPPPDAGLKAFAAPCQKDEECDSTLCVKGLCSMTCKRQSDCPIVRGKPFDCGEIKEGTIGCYPKTYNDSAFGMGHDCSLDGKCGVGYKCMGQAGDADRYCSNQCETDMDCPPAYRCSQARIAKDLEKEKWCRRRQFCHPCVLDDQCGGPEDLCVKDVNGNGYCGKACSKTGATCPPFAKCEDAGNGKLQCRHKSGMCFKSFKSEGKLCDPCIAHGWKKNLAGLMVTIAEEGLCQEDGFCYLLDRYTGEAACITPCSGGKCPSSKYGCAEDGSGIHASLGKELCIPLEGQYIGSCAQ
jgi:hypothetical protein